jgi:probable HAF family extracellular repeat protein
MDHSRLHSVTIPAMLLTAALCQAQTATFRGLGQLQGAIGGTFANDISADGSTVVGYGWVSGAGETAFRWTESSGYQLLGTLGGASADAYSVNADGSVVVGYSYSASNEHLGFRWMPETGMQAVPMYEVIDVSADGSFMIGLNVWRRTDGTTGTFGFLGGNNYTAASGVSADGGVVVGYSETSPNRFAHAFRWTATGGIQDLGVTTGNESLADDVSADGQVVVGQARNLQEFWRAIRWTQAQGMVDIGTLGGPMSAAYNTSADGSVVVGTSLITSSSASNRAFRWSTQEGMRDLKQILLEQGAANVQSWILFTADGVSADGRIITGYGFPFQFAAAEPFIAYLDGAQAPCYANCDASSTTPVLTANDFSCFLNLFASGNSAANCDGSSIQPVLTANDFSCFLNRFAAGCT